MKKLAAALLASASLLAIPAYSENTRVLSWEDLAPRVEFEDPYVELTPQQIADFSFVYWMIQRQQQDIPLDEAERIPLESQYNEAVAALTNAGVDIDALVAKQNDIAEQQRLADRTVVTELDAADIAIPGYAIPLEFAADNRVTEFLLVPYVGACIHVPPPPPNQIVLVQSERGMEINSMYEPVLVSGIMTLQNSEQDLTFLDGTASVPVGYAIAADAVEPYSWF